MRYRRKSFKGKRRVRRIKSYGSSRGGTYL